MTEQASGPEADTAPGAAEAEAPGVAEGAETSGPAGAESEGASADSASAEETDQLASLEAQLAERTEDLQRVSAEFANYRRRVERDRVATVEAAKGAVVAELLPIADDLERAREHGDLEEGPLKVFADKIQALLVAQGVEAFGEEGDAFDPAQHEAVQDESDGSAPVLGTVLRKGYRLGERTLRTAMVIVR